MPKKRLGQHFLTSKGVLKRLAAAGAVEGRSVAEIGAGDGRLSVEILARRPRSLTLIEKDEELAAILKRRFPETPVWVGDALEYDFNEEVVMGNIPYNISGHLVAKLAKSAIKEAILLLQYEFGKRLMAEPGKMSRISAVAQRHFEVVQLFKIPRFLFWPKPKVDGLVVKLIKKKTMDPEFERFSQQLFRYRNKKVSKSLPMAGSLGDKRPRHLRISEIEELYLKWKYEGANG